MLIGDIFYTLAAFFWTIALIPQLLKTYRSKTADDISLIWLYINSTAYICFMCGHVLTNQMYMFYIYILPTAIVFILTILVYKYKHNNLL